MAGTLVDAGLLYAYVDADDDHHESCVELLTDDPGPLVVPALVLSEVGFLLESRLGAYAEVRFVEDLAAGTFVVDAPQPGDWVRVAQLVAKYRDLPLGLVDASVVATAERLGIVRVATLDRRHFGIVRPAHTPLFDVVP
ncbi:MAG: PIN domain-containing protein [Thermoleophilia bacterium]|nr:PIN domain-containing protein [Thermoleophilia bacterium]